MKGWGDFNWNQKYEDKKMREDYCELCNLEHGGKGDREHISVHRKMKNAIKFLGFIPDNYYVREDKKQTGWNLFHDGKTSQENINGALMVLKSHFDRSIIQAIYESFYKKHPDFQKFISLSCLEFLFEEKPNIVSALRKTYGNPRLRMEDGSTYWTPKIHYE